MKLSIILPTFNEAGNILELIRIIFNKVPNDWDFEIIIVDDNSPDGTFDLICRTFGNNDKVIPILRTSDRGLAKSIRTGIEKASGDQILVMDTDFNHNPAEIPKMLHLAQMFDIVSGSRFCAGGNMDDKFRYMCSLIYNWFIRIVLRTQIQDNLAGFFTIKKDKLNRLPFDKIFFGYGDYFFRFLNYSQRSGLSVLEFPTNYKERYTGKSKSNFLTLLCSYTFEVIKFRFKLHK